MRTIDSIRWVGVTSALACFGWAGCIESMQHGPQHEPLYDPALAPEVIELPAWPGDFEPEPAEDLDPADDVVEIELEAREAEVEIAEGRTAPLWTYNGTLPGPRIEARVGDTIRVRFKNSLPQSTTIHWHGLRVENAMDGAPVIQAPIASGEQFTYELHVPDAGTFWYHPHVRSDEQVERGLYGAIVVRGENEPETTTDRVVVLDDILVDPSSFELAPFDWSRQGMVGRQGNVILANGRAHPVIEERRGGLHRYRFVNAANARYFRLALGGRLLTLIGTDGGLLEEPREIDELLLVPGERADVLVIADAEGEGRVTWRSLSYDRGHGTGALPAVDVLEVRATDDEPVETPELPPLLTTIDELPEPSTTRTMQLEESMGGGHGAHGAHAGGGAMVPSFSINGSPYPLVSPLRARLGDVEEWSIVNQTPMDHPFHLHGYRFQIVDDPDGLAAFPAWRDTINVPSEETVRIRMRFEDNPGLWMFHCHILEHAELGMAGELEVQAPE